MKYGVRKPNVKKSIKARTTGKVKRQVKKAVNPLYGKKGMGFVNDPKKAAYNAVYSKTTASVDDILKEDCDSSEIKESMTVSDIFHLIVTFFQLLFILIKLAFCLAFVVALIALVIWIVRL